MLPTEHSQSQKVTELAVELEKKAMTDEGERLGEGQQPWWMPSVPEVNTYLFNASKVKEALKTLGVPTKQQACLRIDSKEHLVQLLHQNAGPWHPSAVQSADGPITAALPPPHDLLSGFGPKLPYNHHQLSQLQQMPSQ